MACICFVLLIIALFQRRVTSAFVPQCSVVGGRMAPRASTPDNNEDTPYSHVKGVVFDVDGTLADSWKLGFDATVVVLQNNGIEQISEHDYHEGTKWCTPERLARHAGLLPTDDDFEAVGNRLGEEFDNMYVDLVNLQTAGFYPGIASLLATIPKEVRLGALTNACVNYAHAVLKANCPVESSDGDSGDHDEAVYSRFLSIRGADNVPTPKPSPDGLWQVCKDLQLDPEQCVYIGDSPSDGMAAKNAGMAAIGVMWGSYPEDRLREAPFDHLCRTVEELQSLMPSANKIRL